MQYLIAKKNRKVDWFHFESNIVDIQIFFPFSFPPSAFSFFPPLFPLSFFFFHSLDSILVYRENNFYHTIMEGKIIRNSFRLNCIFIIQYLQNMFINFREREKHWLIASHMHSDQELNPQLSGVWDDAPTNWATPARACYTVLSTNKTQCVLSNKTLLFSLVIF